MEKGRYGGRVRVEEKMGEGEGQLIAQDYESADATQACKAWTHKLGSLRRAPRPTPSSRS